MRLRPPGLRGLLRPPSYSALIRTLRWQGWKPALAGYPGSTAVSW